MRVACLALLAVCAGAEDRAAAPARAPRATIRADANVVMINVRVADRRDRLVLDLRPEDFRIFEDKVEQRLAYFSTEETPLSIGLLMDTSNSMRHKAADTRLALARFLDTMNPYDEAFLATFADHPSIAVPFTSSSAEIQDAIGRAEMAGRTALHDAVYLALNEMKRARHAAKALLVVSDGADNSSRYSESEVLRLVRESDVQVFSISIGGPDLQQPALAFLIGAELLPEISEQTGGRYFTAPSAAELPVVIERVSRQLRSRYVLGYSPAELRRDGKYRKVEVRIQPQPDLGKLHAQWRRGYYAPAQ